MLQRHKTEHEARMVKLKDQMSKKITILQDQYKVLASQNKKMQERVLDSQERLERLVKPIKALFEKMRTLKEYRLDMLGL